MVVWDKRNKDPPKNDPFETSSCVENADRTALYSLFLVLSLQVRTSPWSWVFDLLVNSSKEVCRSDFTVRKNLPHFVNTVTAFHRQRNQQNSKHGDLPNADVALVCVRDGRIATRRVMMLHADQHCGLARNLAPGTHT